MKQKIEKLVNELACKDLTFGCELECEVWDLQGQLLASGETAPLESKFNQKIIYHYTDDTFMAENGHKFKIFDDELVCTNVKEGFSVKVKGHPITLQTVLMRPEIDIYSVQTIYLLWKEFGDKSLQEIVKNKNSKKLVNYLSNIFL